MTPANPDPTPSPAPRNAADPAMRGPLASSVRLGFIMLYAAVLLLGAGWATSNLRQVPPDSRVVVLRFGRVNRVQESGLLLAWPQPVEQVRLLPAADRQIAYKVVQQNTGFVSDETDMQLPENDDVIHLQGDRDLNNANYLLTGDNNVVSLDATVFFTITDPAAYLLAEDHVRPALNRLYLASAVALAASRSLDDFLVARPDQDRVAQPAGGAEATATLAARRQALRGDLVTAMNRRLLALRQSGMDLGISVGRVDVVALLPPVAKTAFDAVLTATQIADQEAAAARTDAARTLQDADRQHDQSLTEATAAAEERLHTASADTARIDALAAQETQANRDALLSHAYQAQIATILQHAGDVTAVDMRGGQQLVLPGTAP
ncbi:MAG TPA: SPFH domain-containing protein [Rhodopila sp.]|nr:SPFH domain-containing protein [Rhodopila sp.]